MGTRITNLLYNLKRRIAFMFIPVFFSLIAGLIVGGITYWINGNARLSLVIVFGIGFIAYIIYEVFGLNYEEEFDN